MEDGAKCLVLVKKKHMIIPIRESQEMMMKRFSQKLAWKVDDQEDQVVLVAEDGGGSVGGGGGGGGWRWPPRSYSCSFCKREFRSAQALGGHMNVHRRDRALLRQVVSQNIIDHHQPLHPPPSNHHHNHDQKSLSKSLAAPYPSQQFHHRASVQHLSPTRVSSPYYSQSNVISGLEKVINSNDVAEAKMSVGLDFLSGRYQKEEEQEGEEKRLSSKRCKKSGDDNCVAILPFFDEVKCSNVKGTPDLQATKSMEGLDLELRLGLVNQVIN